MNIRMISASGFLVFGLGLAAVSLYNGLPVVALALALAGVYAGLGIFLGVISSLQNPYFQLSAGLIGVLGLVGVFLYNNAFNKDLQGAYIDVISSVGTMELSCRPMTPDLINIQKFAIAACSSQGNSDQMGAVVELGKGLHFGPTLTLVDTGTVLSKDELPNYCVRAFRAANQLCPSAFATMNKASRNALSNAAQ